MDLAPEPTARDQRQSMHARGVAVCERHRDTAAKRVTDDRHAMVPEDLQQVAKDARVPARRVIGVSGSVRLTMSEQVRRDHRVGAGQTRNYLAPGERVVKEAVHQKEGWTAAGDPVHEPVAVQPHLVAGDARNLGRS